MKKALAIVAILLFVLAAILYRRTISVPPEPQVVKPEAGIIQPQPIPEARVDYPVGETEPATGFRGEVPDGSNMAEMLAWLFDGRIVERYLISENFIQRFVFLVDNLPRRDLPTRHLPTRPVPGEFLVRGGEGAWSIDPANYERYRPFLRLVERVDPEKVTVVYARLYPRFQKAYEQLGYPRGYFNDRLVSVIDHLLGTPPASEPIRLQRPKIRYVYADPEREAMSAGRKILLRTGPENMERIKRLLEVYRLKLITLKNDS